MDVKVRITEFIDDHKNEIIVERNIDSDDGSLVGLCNAFIDSMLGYGYMLSSVDEVFDRCIAERKSEE